MAEKLVQDLKGSSLPPQEKIKLARYNIFPFIPSTLFNHIPSPIIAKIRLLEQDLGLPRKDQISL